MIKNLIIVFVALLILILDFFGSFYFIAGKSPTQVFGWYKPAENKNIDLSLPRVSLPNQQVRVENEFTIVRTYVNQKEITAGQSGEINCFYDNTKKDLSDITEEIYLISKGSISEQKEGDNKAFFINRQNDRLDYGTGTLSIRYDIPGVLPYGYYKVSVGLYDENYNLFGRCISDQIRIENAQAGPLISGIVSSQKTNGFIPIISQNQQNIILSIFGNKSLSSVTPKIRIVDPVLKFDKIIMESDQDSINIKSSTQKNYDFKLDNNLQSGIFLLSVSLFDTQGNIIGISPLLPLIVGNPPYIKNTTINKTTDEKYQVNLMYSDGFQNNKSLLKVIVGLCGDKECEYQQKETNGDLTDQITFSKSDKFTGKLAVNILILVKGIGDSIGNYKK